MSKDTKGTGCFTIVAVVVGLFLLTALSRVVFMVLEVLALAFTHLGIEDPVVAWVGLGIVLGALVGLVVGLRRNGRRKQWAEFGFAAAAILLLAFAGVGSVESQTLEPVRASPPPAPALFSGTVTAEALNVRAGPSPSQRTVARLLRGTRVEVLDAPGAWIRVRYATPQARGEGWVSRQYVRFDNEASPSSEPESEPEQEAITPVAPPPQPAAPRVYRLGELSSPPQLVRKPALQRSMPGGFEGPVRVRVVVGEGGRVEEAECAAAVPRGVCSQAESAARQAVFTPGRLNGRAVRAQTQIFIPFEALPPAP